MKCPKCGSSCTFRELSCGGDGLYFCDECNWIEDPTEVTKAE